MDRAGTAREFDAQIKQLERLTGGRWRLLNADAQRPRPQRGVFFLFRTRPAPLRQRGRLAHRSRRHPCADRGVRIDALELPPTASSIGYGGYGSASHGLKPPGSGSSRRGAACARSSRAPSLLLVLRQAQIYGYLRVFLAPGSFVARGIPSRSPAEGSVAPPCVGPATRRRRASPGTKNPSQLHSHF